MHISVWGVIIIAMLTNAFGDHFRLQLSVQNVSTTYTDLYNYFGISPAASDSYDIYDMINLFPPEAHYIDLYFPHDDPSRSDYWPPPYTGKYAADIRHDEFDTKVFYFDVFSTATATESVAIFWQETDSVPPNYKIEIKPLHGNGVNIFQCDTLWQVIPPGVHYYIAIVQKDAYNHITLLPKMSFICKNERFFLHTYLVGPEDSIEISPQIEVFGDAIRYANGAVLAVTEGTAMITANFRGFADTAWVFVGGTALPITINLRRGWNFISLPVRPSTNRLEFLFGHALNDILEYRPTENSFSTPTNITPGTGYFIFTSFDTSITIAGQPIASATIEIHRGWNAIGAISVPVDWNRLSSRYPGVFVGMSFCLDDNGYQPSDTLYPGKGYWIYSKTETTLIITP